MHIDRDLTPAEIEALYATAHCLAYPSRAEGFGLPIAEAMARGIPVIATAYGGHMDFCSEATAWLIDYRLVPVAGVTSTCRERNGPSPTSINCVPTCVPSPAIARPPCVRRKVDAARAADSQPALVCSGGALRRGSIATGATAQRCATACALAMVTSWNSRCGIAEYSRYLLDALLRVAPGVQPVVLSSAAEGLSNALPAPSYHCWDPPPLGDLRMLPGYLDALGIDIVHFQHNFGFFALRRARRGDRAARGRAAGRS